MGKPGRVAVATASKIAADAAAETAARGGNAVDCAVAAAMVTVNTEPGVCALAGGAYATVWHPDEDPVTVDGNVAVPGLGRAPGAPPPHGVDVHLDYGGGIDTVVGCGAVGVPGTLAALELAWKTWGNCRWQDVLAPAIRAAEQGFPLPRACRYYLEYAGDTVFGRSADGHRALHDDSGALLDAGATVHVPHLADSLRLIAEGGAREFYEGRLAERIAEHVGDGGGALGLEDLARYEAIVRPALYIDLEDFRIATNPPPAVGGAVLGAMLQGFVDAEGRRWDEQTVRRLVAVQEAVLSYRKSRVDFAPDVGAAAATLLEVARAGELPGRWQSAATVHTSAVDEDGLACAITASSGYGSGEMPAETGLWLNNCLGELELNRHGLAVGPPGKRLPSNMAPGVARSERSVLAFGSPGADRITTALQQFLVSYVQMGMTLEEAIAHPRLHVQVHNEPPSIAVEAGLEMPSLDAEVRTFPDLNMYFGGVGAARFDLDGGLTAAADPRREGGTCVTR